MRVFARKRSNDPVQEALRTHKDNWNLAVKEFISRIIAFKRALNGRGDSKYNLPTSDIKNPLPDQIGGFLHQLAGSFEVLVTEADRIKQEQSSYSENRKKTQLKQPKASFENKIIKRAFTGKFGTLEVKEYAIPTVLAVTMEEQARGLMFYDWPPPVMSFIYSSPRVNKFWMQNTPSPLDIVFCRNGEVLSIYKGEPYSTASVGSDILTDLVIEFPFGTCEELNIKIGDKINLIK